MSTENQNPNRAVSPSQTIARQQEYRSNQAKVFAHNCAEEAAQVVNGRNVLGLRFQRSLMTGKTFTHTGKPFTKSFLDIADDAPNQPDRLAIQSTVAKEIR